MKDVFKLHKDKFILSEGYDSIRSLNEGILDMFKRKDKTPESTPEPAPAEPAVTAPSAPSVSFEGITNIAGFLDKLSRADDNGALERYFLDTTLNKIYSWGNKNNIKFNETEIYDQIDHAIHQDVQHRNPTEKPVAKSSLSKDDVTSLTNPVVKSTVTEPEKYRRSPVKKPQDASENPEDQPDSEEEEEEEEKEEEEEENKIIKRDYQGAVRTPSFIRNS